MNDTEMTSEFTLSDRSHKSSQGGRSAIGVDCKILRSDIRGKVWPYFGEIILISTKLCTGNKSAKRVIDIQVNEDFSH